LSILKNYYFAKGGMMMSSYSNIFEAAERGSVDDVKYFFEKKNIPVDVQNMINVFETPLHVVMGHWDIYNGENNKNILKIVEYLISNKAPVNAINSVGNTPLHYATIFGSPLDVIKILIFYGADVNKENFDGKTPLHYAAGRESDNDDDKKNDIEVLKFLISQGADVNKKTPGFFGLFGKKPIDFAKVNDIRKILFNAMK